MARAIRQMGERLKEDQPAREKFLSGVEALRRSIPDPLVSIFREEFLKMWRLIRIYVQTAGSMSLSFFMIGRSISNTLLPLGSNQLS